MPAGEKATHAQQRRRESACCWARKHAFCYVSGHFLRWRPSSSRRRQGRVAFSLARSPPRLPHRQCCTQTKLLARLAQLCPALLDGRLQHLQRLLRSFLLGQLRLLLGAAPATAAFVVNNDFLYLTSAMRATLCAFIQRAMNSYRTGE